jgi:lipopolysaccharide biosynthesis glycosyltransferase
MTNLTVYLGWDPKEEVAFRVAKASILKYNKDIRVQALVKSGLRECGIYTRLDDVKASTEFTLTRFLTPFLSEYKGFSLFMDCDILCSVDIATILDDIDTSKAVSVVKHDYTPKSDTKMDDKKQYNYPRKNWSSVMLFNNEKCQHLTPTMVNDETPAFLHRFGWLEDNQIGSLNHTWNYLAGYYHDIDEPNIIHYTDGGPWFHKYQDAPLAEKWMKFYEENDISSVSRGTP